MPSERPAGALFQAGRQVGKKIQSSGKHKTQINKLGKKRRKCYRYSFYAGKELGDKWTDIRSERKTRGERQMNDLQDAGRQVEENETRGKQMQRIERKMRDKWETNGREVETPKWKKLGD